MLARKEHEAVRNTVDTTISLTNHLKKPASAGLSIGIKIL